MKNRVFAFLLAVVMVLSMTACGSKTENYKLGMGIVVDDSSKEGTAQVDATIAAVVVDESGKIVACALDVSQLKADITDGVMQDAATIDLRSKQAKGDDYNMVKFGGAIAEWYEQADFFAAAVVGKTAAEVAALEVGGEHGSSTDEAILAGCTMGIGDFKEAIVKACNDEYAKSFAAAKDSFKLGLACVAEVDSSSKSATADEDGVASLYTGFAAVVVDEKGAIMADLVDYIQPKINFDATGNETSFGFKATKKELKDDYNMVAFGGSIAEWYQQATSFEDYVVGKTAAEVTAIETTVNESGHHVAVDADLFASVTISISDFQEQLAAAIANAK